MNLLCLLMLDLLGEIPMAMEDIGKDIENMAGDGTNSALWFL